MRSTYLTSLEDLKKYFPYSIIKISKTVLYWINNYTVPSKDSKLSMTVLSLGIVSNFPKAVTLLCLIKGTFWKCKFWKKTLKVHLIVEREWPKNTPHLRNLDNSPPGAFYSILFLKE